MPSNPPQRVVLLGASDRPERYAYLAMQQLIAHGHEVILVHPRLQQIEGHPVLQDLSAVQGMVDTLTIYVGSANSSSLLEKFLSLRPGRVLFNPGAENPDLAQKLQAQGIVTEEACTLVLLRTGQF